MATRPGRVMTSGMRATAAIPLVSSLLVVSLVGCPSTPAPPRPKPAPAAPAPEPTTPSALPSRPGEMVRLEDKAMGTRVLLLGFTTEALNEAAVHTALRRAYEEILRLERLMTTWRDDSEVSRINAAAGKEAIAVSDETFEVIAKSLWIAKLSEGTFDITFASMGDLWKFDEDRGMEIPPAAAIEKARKKIDYRKIEIDPAKKTVKLTSPDSRINLGGIAKGYAIDKAAAVLREAGLTSFFAQAGGDLYVEGTKPDGTPFRVGVRDPRGPGETFFAVVPVEDHAFSTAGDYERAFVKGGKRYHHIIDPRTGYPATESRSVTIWAKDAFTADAIDDAVFILGPVKGMALVEAIEDCGAVIVDKQNGVHVSKRLDGVIKILRDPTPGL